MYLSSSTSGDKHETLESVISKKAENMRTVMLWHVTACDMMANDHDSAKSSCLHRQNEHRPVTSNLIMGVAQNKTPYL